MAKDIIYHENIPKWMQELAETPQMQRLKDVGMNCGCEYTHFDTFRNLPKYSRYQHSLGTALIVWHFTGSMEQAVAALFHDIATPTFAHTIDFMHGDYIEQESTEQNTKAIIKDSIEIKTLLDQYEINSDHVIDYHEYPIADNDSPRLSSDRLEYSVGNICRYGIRKKETVQKYYDNICITTLHNQEEMAFQDEEIALHFALDALACSKIYVSDEDRYAMQILSELVAGAMEKKVIHLYDLYSTEQVVISKITSDRELCVKWENYCALHEMVCEEEKAPIEKRRVVSAKKRYIDPYVYGKGRLSKINKEYSNAIQVFLQTSQDQWICGK